MTAAVAAAAAFNGANDKTRTVQKEKKKRKGDVKEREKWLCGGGGGILKKKKKEQTHARNSSFTPIQTNPPLPSPFLLLLPFFFLSLNAIEECVAYKMENHTRTTAVCPSAAAGRGLQAADYRIGYGMIGSLVSGDVYINLKTKGLLCGHLVRRRTHYVTDRTRASLPPPPLPI